MPPRFPFLPLPLPQCPPLPLSNPLPLPLPLPLSLSNSLPLLPLPLCPPAPVKCPEAARRRHLSLNQEAIKGAPGVQGQEGEGDIGGGG